MAIKALIAAAAFAAVLVGMAMPGPAADAGERRVSTIETIDLGSN